MGEDGEEMLSSSNFDKPSQEDAANEEQLDPIEEKRLSGGALNDAVEQREFVPESADSNVSAPDSKDGEGLARKEEETGDMHGADNVEDKQMEAEAEVGGGGGHGRFLTEKVGREDSVFTGGDVEVTNEETPVELVSVQTGLVGATEEVEEAAEAVESKEVASATAGGVTEENDSVVSVSEDERSHETVLDDFETAVAEGEKLNTESTVASGAEEGAGMAVEIVGMMGAEKEVDELDGGKTTAEEMIMAEVESKVDAVAVFEVIKEESDPEKGSGLEGLEVPKEGIEDKEVGGVIKGTEEIENLGSSDMQYDNGQQPVILVDEKANEELLPDQKKEAETEAINASSNVESLQAPVDTAFIQQEGDDKDEELVAEEEGGMVDTRLDAETHVLQEEVVSGTGNQAEIKTVDDIVQSIPSAHDAKLVPRDGDGQVVANDDPDLIGSEMEVRSDAGQEPRVLILQQAKEAETKIGEVADVDATPTTHDAKHASLDEEEQEMLTEDGSVLAGTEMDTETETGDTMITTEKEEALDNVEGLPEIDDIDHVPQNEGTEEMAAEESALAEAEETETDVGESSRVVGEKSKRGKNAKASTKSKTSSKTQKIMGEDVCFICFDGGDLFLCDRRGCSKAYHTSCVDRDEAFFQTKGRWNCGWHYCNFCKKNAQYMCYTCPYSLCKGCIKDGVIFCVRGNKGFCETCMKTVKLIEDSSEGNNDVDFNDQSSWEFLFKDYYTDLKSKLSLTSAEIGKARNPWKGSDISISKEESPETPIGHKDGGVSSNDAKNSEGAKPKRKKAKKRSRSVAEEEDSADAPSSPSNEEWASKELLEFVMHMKNGDASVLSQFDVQALLLEYIKRNKLRDPRRKSQIICDSRLENIFGKPRVGHFEMLKLLESHFLVKEDAHTDDVQGSAADSEVNQTEADEDDDTVTKGAKEKKRKIRKKSDRVPLSNRYDYAAIDTHNISLIYLRRKLMEDILEDGDNFENKVTNTFVRIRISGSNQKQDLYRLVKVVGTSKAAEPYKVGKKTTDVMLEIFNLNKTEIVSIDAISNQDFTEEECKRLRQSIKCGLLDRMTVGDILDKAMELQTVRVNDWLESETQRLSHLRDRASDMGHRKEYPYFAYNLLSYFSECVEKLQILKTPEERLRRLEEVPKIHADPKMDPNNESEDNDSETEENKQEGLLRTSGSSFARRARAPISSGSDFSPKDSWNGGNTPSKNWESSKNVFSKNLPSSGEDGGTPIDMGYNNTSWSQGRDKAELKSSLSLSSQSENVGLNINSMTRTESVSGVTVNSLVSQTAKEVENVVKINDTQKMWHYQDPSGKVQGPFSMTQLRKWNNTGYFPSNLRIWKTGEKQDDSILLTDALAGRFQKESSVESKLATAGALNTAHGLSGHYAKTPDSQLQLSREETLGERSNAEQNRGLSILQQMAVLKGSVAPSVEVPTEKWSRTDLSNLPSPTPGRNAGEVGGAQSLVSGLSSHYANIASVNSSAGTKELLINGRDGDSGSATIGSGHALQATSLAHTGEARSMEDLGHHLRAQDNPNGIPLISNQNSQTESHGWGGPPMQKVESNPLTPVPGQQQQAYNQWGSAITPPAQNPVMPQPEFWGQSNQTNMQTPPPLPNVGWGTGPHAETNSPAAPALRPDNSTTGWAPNMGWVAPPQGPPNMNWGSTVQGPAPGNANSGWVAAPGDAGSSIPGQIPGNVNSGWVAQPVAVPSAAGWGAPGGNVGPGGPVPAPGSGWGPMGPGNQGGPSNQGWGAPPGNQGGWGNGSQGGDPGYGGGRPWNRQSSFGRRGGNDLRNVPRDILCPYNTHGRCRKGNRCNYIHS
ncbi:OLC1v1002255C1 [Oldenlandia corymbosa var. corymbosa]|uniref:OLC1v1002255C1 n=1 Tax=Oldenlandia corymbosa var. corymbosa TaxID=529605 RepID=A0AAV1D7V9_OLDCO|nr:OLC1v1002255C1 [Oldenlandia corymbosa var. corymbosa]